MFPPRILSIKHCQTDEVMCALTVNIVRIMSGQVIIQVCKNEVYFKKRNEHFVSGSLSRALKESGYNSKSRHYYRRYFMLSAVDR